VLRLNAYSKKQVGCCVCTVHWTEVTEVASRDSGDRYVQHKAHAVSLPPAAEQLKGIVTLQVLWKGQQWVVAVCLDEQRGLAAAWVDADTEDSGPWDLWNTHLKHRQWPAHPAPTSRAC
jgi:hypothetical protein